VAAANFIANSRASKEALKSANILKSLNINVIIEGPVGAGKETLARYISPEASTIDEDLVESGRVEEEKSDLIVLNIDRCKNLHFLDSLAKRYRIIATSSTPTKSDIIERIFPIRIFLPPLSEREEDILPLAGKFLQELKESFSEEIDIDLESVDFDLSQNGDSLKKSVYFHYFAVNADEKKIMACMESFLKERIGTGNDYKEFLFLYEKPLIRAGFKRFKSQLKMAQMFGLNRNTLRKKIKEYEEKE